LPVFRQGLELFDGDFESFHHAGISTPWDSCAARSIQVFGMVITRIF
jgi:hypothetical protein